MQTWREGGCHCGAVRFRVRSDFQKADLCNCSICTRKGFIHLIVEKKDFELLQGEDALGCYTFNTGVAKHFFCATCGISPYYIPRSHPDGVDVNLRCVEDIDLEAVTLLPFDGRNWEANIDRIKGYDR
ncbi:MAG: GFA family protein [Pseudomonadales bacterium]|nr:GFA family protein [Pseudomonadales bacterium]